MGNWASCSAITEPGCGYVSDCCLEKLARHAQALHTFGEVEIVFHEFVMSLRYARLLSLKHSSLHQHPSIHLGLLYCRQTTLQR